MKILTVLGARPQFIKASSISREILIRNYNGFDVNEVIVHTGQHFDKNMSDIFFDELQIPEPKYSLGIGGLSHCQMTGKLISVLEDVYINEKPDFVLVYGDTNSTLAGSLAAAKLTIPIIHIESGLRSFNMNMPEEVNRIITDRLSNYLFCPTKSAVQNLLNEGSSIWTSNVHLVGDVMLDVARYYENFAKKPAEVKEEKEFTLLTIHREENTKNIKNLQNILLAISDLSENNNFIFPVHPNTRKKILDLEIQMPSNVQVINPVSYLEMLWLLKNCNLVITDSGGLQKEAYFFIKNCITIRNETEWIELVDDNHNILVGADPKKIINTFNNHIFSSSQNHALFGDGNSSKRMLDILLAS
jgi:UDP-GlcNAc3NAcA epimerase